jgi:hypothetical protein
MKIIELLNKIANGEEVPKNIKVDDKYYKWCNSMKDYEEENSYKYLVEELETEELNDEVEIINNEKWKTIVDFPNYEISTNGEVRTKEYYDSRNHLRKSKLLEKQVNNAGYEYVILSNDIEKHKTLTVHRLVAKTFFNDYCDNLEVNHINGIKTDNRIENLEMTTHCENIKKRYEIGNDGNNYKEVEQYDLDGNYIKTYKSSYEAEKMTGISRTCIGGCCRNEHHTAGGYIWKFKSKIEEDKKIEKLYVKERANDFLIGKSEHICFGTESYVNKIIADKINEIIDEVNKMKEGK